MLIVFPIISFSAIYAGEPEKHILPGQKQNRPLQINIHFVADKKQQTDADQDDFSSESDLPLKETKDWITDKINTQAGATITQGNITYACRYSGVRFNDNTLMFKVSTKAEATGFYKSIKNANYTGKAETTSVNDVTLALSDIDPANIKLSKLPDGKTFGIILSTVNGKKKILIKSTINTKLKTYPRKPQELFPMFMNDNQDTSDIYNKLTLVFQDADVAKSVAKAFTHAINLSKGQKGPFETDAGK
jgi:hypothetical protein